MRPLLSISLVLIPLSAHAQSAGYEVTWSQRDMPAYDTFAAWPQTTFCPPGKIAIGGGWETDSMGSAMKSHPTTSATGASGWHVEYVLDPALIDGKLKVYAVCINAQQTGTPADTTTDVTPTGALLFEDFSDANLSQWVGKSEGAHSGSVVADPLNSANKVLVLSEVVPAGDMFSSPITVTPGHEYAMCFDYMGRPVSTAGAGNGGAIGIAAGTPGHHRWLAGTAAAGGIERGILEDDRTWHSYRVVFLPEIASTSVTSLRIMLEDFTGTTGDVYFDNIKLVSAAEGC